MAPVGYDGNFLNRLKYDKSRVITLLSLSVHNEDWKNMYCEDQYHISKVSSDSNKFPF